MTHHSAPRTSAIASPTRSVYRHPQVQRQSIGIAISEQVVIRSLRSAGQLLPYLGFQNRIHASEHSDQHATCPVKAVKTCVVSIPAYLLDYQPVTAQICNHVI